MATAMEWAQLETTSPKNMRVMPADPQVKSAKTCKLFNAGVLGNSKSAKTTDPTCYTWSRSMRTGLFEKVERPMSDHRFKPDDIVTIFQMHPSKGLLIEGKAVIHKIVPDVDEQYEVRFISEPLEVYERFVDAWGQSNPKKYVQDFNRKIGKVA